MRTVLLCAGDIGFQAAAAVLPRHSEDIVGLVSYRVEEPQDVFLAKLADLASHHGVPFFDLSGNERGGLAHVWDTLRPDLAITIKWRTLIDEALVATVSAGVVVFHASLLPKYRGFAPIPWPLINGESETGLTMFYATEEVDAGDIIDQRPIAITTDDDAATLEQKVARMAAEMLSANLPLLVAGTAPRLPQNHADATYCIWRRPEDGEIDWSLPAADIHNLVRGLTYPYPGAFTTVGGEKLTIWRTALPEPPRRYVGAIPGKVESTGVGRPVGVVTGDGVIELHDVQLDGGERRPSWEVVTKLYTHLGK